MLSGGLSRAAAAPRRLVRGQLRLLRDSVECFVGMDGFDRSMALAAQASPPDPVILARRLPWQRLVPQAVLAALGMAVLRAGSALYLPRALSSSAHQFGSIGVAFTIVSWLFAAALVLTASAAIGATLSRTRPEGAARSHGATTLSPGADHERPAIPSPMSFAPITRHSTVMIAALWAVIHDLRSPSTRWARAPNAK
jgi:hypothetical protein